MELKFEWDRNKAAANLRKHDVAFDEARTVFSDGLLITFPDDFHSDGEDRFISIGFSAKGRVLLVVHTEEGRSKNEIVIRIISSRRANPLERKIYEKRK